MGDELSREQAQNGVNFDFEVKFDLEGQGQSPPKTIGILTKVFYTYGPNLVILAWTGDELSRGQTWWRTDGLTDGRTDAGNDNTRRPILASGKKPQPSKNLDVNEINIWQVKHYFPHVCITTAKSQLWHHHQYCTFNYEVFPRTLTEKVRHDFDVWKSCFWSSFMGSLCHARSRIMYVPIHYPL